MREKIRHHASVAWYMIGMNLKSDMEYPAFLLGWILSNMAQFGVGLGTLKALTLSFDNINGWSFEEIALMYGIGIISHGIVVTFFIQTRAIQWFVRNGDFDQMLTRPMGVFFQFSFSVINVIGITDLIPGIIIFVYGAAAIPLQFTVRNMLYLSGAIVGGVLIRSGIYTAAGSVSFWTKSGDHLIHTVNSIFSQIMMYPLTIFNTAIQALLTFALPLGFIAFYPAANLLNKPIGLSIPGALPLWALGAGLLVTVLGQLVFRLGMRHYDSTGS